MQRTPVRRNLRRHRLPQLQAAVATPAQGPEVLSHADMSMLETVQELLKFMSGDKIKELYHAIETRERDEGLEIEINVEDVLATELKIMYPPTGEGLPPKFLPVTPEMVSEYRLTIPIVEIKHMTVVEGGEAKQIPRFSTYFFKSSGKSRGTGTKDMWLPSGDVQIKHELSNIRFSKLEDEILSRVTAILDRFERLDKTKENYPTLYPQFIDEFPTWDALMQSILKYGRFISETNAMISHKLYLLHGASGVRAEGRKVTKAKPKKKGKGTLKGSKSKSKGQGKDKGTLRGKPRSKRKKGKKK